ncbi:MAG TPA: hypothetical protein VFI11_07530 [Anaerolineales bacterium]|nr:hypothetical protein [Anaerolineales bacterium]
MNTRATLLLIHLLATGLACSLLPQAPGEDVSETEGSSSPTSAASPPILSTGPLCSGPQPPFLTERSVLQPRPLVEPAARAPFRDPAFGTCIVRVTDRRVDLSPDDPSRGLKNEYSRVSSFNADGTRLLARGTAATWYLYDAVSLEPLGPVPIDGVDPRWDANDPDLLYFSQETRLMAYRLSSGDIVVVHDFAADFPGETLAAVWSKYEGTASLDGRYWGFMAEDENWVTVAFLVYDLTQDRVLAIRDMRGMPGVEAVDNAYISPLGDYFIADFSDFFCERGRLGTDAEPCGYMVYDQNLQNGRGLLRISGHMDLALDAEGREVVVYQDIDTDTISMADLASGSVTPLVPIDFSHTPLGLHVSGNAFRAPGWVVISTYNGGHPSAFTWMDDSVFALELRPGGRTVRLAHTRSVFADGPVEYGEKDYWAEPHASLNQDFTRVLFTSNWGRSGTEEVEMYMIELPPNWYEQLP